MACGRASRREGAGSGDGSGDGRTPGFGPDGPGPDAALATDAGASTDADANPDAEPDPASVARAIVLRQLTSSAKSRLQLSRKLAERNIPEDVAEAVLDRFQEVRLIDDAEFADMWVRSRSQSRKLAKGALRRELADKGIDPDTAAAALEQLSDAAEEVSAGSWWSASSGQARICRTAPSGTRSPGGWRPCLPARATSRRRRSGSSEKCSTHMRRPGRTHRMACWNHRPAVTAPPPIRQPGRSGNRSDPLPLTGEFDHSFPRIRYRPVSRPSPPAAPYLSGAHLRLPDERA
ncbi:regulatory protein RecX [Arthrobacter sp. Hiyo4]|nr:regulatory protein RecX [Arthrobacter sp. Hiyo4]